jgi:hypothetical protein
MHKATVVAILPLLLTGLAGCGQEKPDPLLPTWEERCIFTTCLANPNSPDALQVKRRFGFHQITGDGDRADQARPYIEGDWVIWQAELPENLSAYGDDGVYANILGYNVETQEFLALGDSGPGYLRARAHMAEGRVVFTKVPKAGAPDFPGHSYMMLWDFADRSIRRLDPGLNGSQDSLAFDGEWVVFMNSNGTRALHAMNVDTGKVVHLYTLLPGRKTPEGNYESFAGEAVNRGNAYYYIVRVTPDTADVNRTRTVYRVNLTTAETSVFYFGQDQPAIVDLHMSGHYWVTASDNANIFMDLDYPESGFQTYGEGKYAAPRRGSNDWVANPFFREKVGFGVEVFHLPTTEPVLKVVEKGFAFVQAATDGRRVAVVGARNSGYVQFEDGGSDLYWIDLPSPRA